MNNEKNLKNSINKAMKTPANKPHVDSTNGQQNEYGETSNQPNTEPDIRAEAQDTYEHKQKRKSLKNR